MQEEEANRQQQQPGMSQTEGDTHCHNWFDRHIGIMIQRCSRQSLSNPDGSLKSHEELTRIAIATQWNQLIHWLEHGLGRDPLEWRRELAIYPENLARLHSEAHLELKRSHRHERFYVYHFEFLPYAEPDVAAPEPEPTVPWWIARIEAAQAPEFAKTIALELMAQLDKARLANKDGFEMNSDGSMIQLCFTDFCCQIDHTGLTALHDSKLHTLIRSPITGPPSHIAWTARALVEQALKRQQS